jgi:hypothetical protein
MGKPLDRPKMTKNLLTIAFVFLLSIVQGQTDKKKYEYEICVYHKSTDKPALLKNQVVGIADTTLSIIRGHIYDYKNKPLAFSPVGFDNKSNGKKTGCVSDTSGSYIIFLPPGQYSMTAIFIGYSDFKLNDITTTSGQIREIEAKLGNGNGFTMHNIISDKPLSKTKLKRIERRLRRKN